MKVLIDRILVGTLVLMVIGVNAIAISQGVFTSEIMSTLLLVDLVVVLLISPLLLRMVNPHSK